MYACWPAPAALRAPRCAGCGVSAAASLRRPRLLHLHPPLSLTSRLPLPLALHSCDTTAARSCRGHTAAAAAVAGRQTCLQQPAAPAIRPLRAPTGSEYSPTGLRRRAAARAAAAAARAQCASAARPPAGRGLNSVVYTLAAFSGPMGRAPLRGRQAGGQADWASKQIRQAGGRDGRSPARAAAVAATTTTADAVTEQPAPGPGSADAPLGLQAAQQALSGAVPVLARLARRRRHLLQTAGA